MITRTAEVLAEIRAVLNSLDEFHCITEREALALIKEEIEESEKSC